MPAIIVESPTIKPGAMIPRAHTSQGANTSPALTWRGLPQGTQEIVVALEDLDNHMFPRETTFVQWLVYGIPPTATGLPADIAQGDTIDRPAEIAGAHQARTHYDMTGYRGPEPPAGELHHYRFVVYALGASLTLGSDAPAQSVRMAMAALVIGEGSIAATYTRTP